MKKIYIHYICLKLLFINITAVNLFAQAPTDNLVAHFDFESITNNNISAASGSASANVGTLNNVTPATENGNTVLEFDSSTTPSYVRFDQSNSDEFRFAEDYTLSMALWLKPTLLNAGDQVLLSINKDDGSTRHYIELRGSNTFNVFLNTKDYEGTDAWQSVFLAADLQGSFLTNDDMNNWIHFAFTYDGTDIKLYINGSLVREKTLTVARQNTGLVHFNDAALHFGGVWGETPGTITEAFTGSIDDVYLYEDTLTATEIANIYSASTLSINDLDNNEKFNVYPIPVYNNLNIKGLSKPVTYLISSIEGKTIKNGVFQESIDVSDLKSGLYFLQVETKDPVKFIKK
jgi:hypothetical protein